MADGSPAGPADGLTPEQEEVRRLLADARHSGPMPDDVADRLDSVLAGLAAGSADELDGHAAAPAGGAVVSLASRRRRRAATALVAAAAVVAVGIGLGQVVGDGWAAAGVPTASPPAAARARERGRPRRPGRSARQRRRPDGQCRASRERPADPATALLEPTCGGSAGGPGGARRRPAAARPPGALELRLSDACAAGQPGPAAVVPVALRPPSAASWSSGRSAVTRQVVELFRCGSPEALRSITLPAP